jgi:hypothetical protein
LIPLLPPLPQQPKPLPKVAERCGFSRVQTATNQPTDRDHLFATSNNSPTNSPNGRKPTENHDKPPTNSPNRLKTASNRCQPKQKEGDRPSFVANQPTNGRSVTSFRCA